MPDRSNSLQVSMRLKSFAARVLESSGFVKRGIGKRSRDSYLILMYHRVVPATEAEPGLEPGMHVEPETFDMHIGYLRRHFRITPMSEIPACSRNPSLRSNGKPVCILTFDDGWHDFYKHAYPILESHRTCATVFLPTDFIGTRNRFWTDRLADLFVRGGNRFDRIPRGRYEDRPGLAELAGLGGTTESRIEKAIRLLKNYREEEITRTLDELQSIWDVDLPDPEPVFLDWEEARRMAGTGLISFGSHTAGHRILTGLDDTEINEELTRSKDRLLAERVVDPAFLPFCYPNGNYDHGIAGRVKEAGYHVAVTTEDGWNPRTADPFTLRRSAVHQDMTRTKAMFGCRIANIM